jgi:hypothetical protein
MSDHILERLEGMGRSTMAKSRARRGLAIMIGWAVLASPAAAAAGPQEASPRPGSATRLAAAAVLYQGVTVQRLDGSVVSGALLGIGDDALLIRRGGREEAIPRSELRRVVIEREKDKPGYAVAGIPIGFVVDRALMGHLADGQPGLFLSTGYRGEFNLWDLLLIAGVGSLGYFGGPLLESGQAEFEPGPGSPRAAREWDALRRYVLGIFSPPRFHVEFFGGKLALPARDGFLDQLRGLGYSTGYAYELDTSYTEATGAVNLMRRVRISFSISPRFAVGLAWVDLSQPSVSGTRSEGYNPVHSAAQRLSCRGYFAVGSYEPLKSLLPSRVAWEAGLGAGLIRARYSLSTAVDSYFYAYLSSSSVSRNDQGFSRTDPAGLLFTSLRYYLNSHTSIGLSADTVLAPSAQVNAVPELGLAARTIRLGNSGIGLTLGVHF